MDSHGNSLKIVHTSDWHLGHPRTSTSDTIAGIKKYLFPELEADLLTITGDIFDKNVSFDSEDAIHIVDFLADVISRCYQTGTTLRVLQGTFTHDRNQLLVWNRLYKKLGLPIDYKLFRSLDIEYLPNLNIHLLYVPDDLPFKHHHEVFSRIDDLMTTHNIKQVDYILFHGEFDNTKISKFTNNAFKLSEFSKYCKNNILAGHIHSSQKYGKLLYAGSFNRLAHNEEEAKGFWVIEGKDSRFVENMDATKFITVDYSKDDDLDHTLDKHRKIVSNIAEGTRGYIRAIVQDPHIKQALKSYHISNFGWVKLTFKTKATDIEFDQYIGDKLSGKKTDTLEVPSSENIARLICQHLAAKSYELSIDEVNEILN